MSYEQRRLADSGQYKMSIPERPVVIATAVHNIGSKGDLVAGFDISPTSHGWCLGTGALWQSWARTPENKH